MSSSSIHPGSGSAEPPSVGESGVDSRSAQRKSSPFDSIHERLTIAEVKSDGEEPATVRPVTSRDGWLTFDAYVAWVAAANGVTTTALSTPVEESERAIEDRRSTVIIPSRRSLRRKAWPMWSGPVHMPSKRPRLSASVVRRVLAKTG